MITMEFAKKKRLWTLVHGVIADYRYGEKGKRNGRYWVQYQPFSIRGVKGVVMVDAYGVVNRTFERLSRKQIESALMDGRALFITVDDPDYRDVVEPLVTHWVTSDADVHKVEAALRQYFDLTAVIAVDDHLGNPPQWKRNREGRILRDAEGRGIEETHIAYSEVSRHDPLREQRKITPALPSCQAILPGCRVVEWGDSVCTAREDLRPYAYPIGELEHARELVENGLDYHGIKFAVDKLSGPYPLESHEWPAVVLAFQRLIEEYLEMVAHLRWGAYPDHLANSFHSTLAGYGLEGYTDRILKAVYKYCTHKGVQEIHLPGGACATVDVR